VLLSILSLCLSFKVGDHVCLDAGLNLRDSACGSIIKTTQGGEHGKVTNTKSQECSFGSYTWIQVNFTGTLLWGAQETDLIHMCSSGGVDYPVPYVHQLWDTGNIFNGGWACGPTSSVMAVSYFNRIGKRPITTDKPYVHQNDYGWYVSNIYTSNQTSFIFNRGQTDASGKMAYGAYGTCTDGGGAWAFRMQTYCEKHGLTTKFYDAATFASIKAALDKKHLIILSTQLSSVGHIILIRGYTSNNLVVANDPYGDANQPGWGTKINGADVKYTWEKVKAKWMVEVWA